MKRLNYFFRILLLFCIGLVGSSNIDLDATANTKRQLIYDNVKALTSGEERPISFSSVSRDQMSNILGSCAGVVLKYCAAQCVDCGEVYYPSTAYRGVPTIWIGESCARCGSFDFQPKN